MNWPLPMVTSVSLSLHHTVLPPHRPAPPLPQTKQEYGQTSCQKCSSELKQELIIFSLVYSMDSTPYLVDYM